MRLISWNVNGIRAAAKKGFLEWIEQEQPDVLAIQETKAHKEQLSNALLAIPGYHAYFCSGERKGYSGTAIYTKKEPISVSRELGVEEFDNEGRHLILEYDDFFFFNSYFPNGGQGPIRLKYKLDYYELFLKVMEEYRAKGKNIIVCGDVNTAHSAIDLARPKENEKNTGFLPEERAWIDKLLNHKYLDTFRMFNNESGNYSWWDYKTRARDRNVGWRLDYFFVNEEFGPRVKDAFILTDIMGSDHCPVGIEIE